MIVSITIFFVALIAIAVLLGRHIASVRRMEIDIDTLKRRYSKDVNRTYLVSIQEFLTGHINTIKRIIKKEISIWTKNVLRVLFGYARRKTVKLRNYIGHTHVENNGEVNTSEFLQQMDNKK
jgi:hypothetical protein